MLLWKYHLLPWLREQSHPLLACVWTRLQKKNNAIGIVKQQFLSSTPSFYFLLFFLPSHLYSFLPDFLPDLYSCNICNGRCCLGTSLQPQMLLPQHPRDQSMSTTTATHVPGAQTQHLPRHTGMHPDQASSPPLF